jgi:hypothetical protein
MSVLKTIAKAPLVAILGLFGLIAGVLSAIAGIFTAILAPIASAIGAVVRKVRRSG